MNLVVNQMMQFQDTHVTDGNFLVFERLAAAAARKALFFRQAIIRSVPKAARYPSSVAPSNTGVATLKPSAFAAMPR